MRRATNRSGRVLLINPTYKPPSGSPPGGAIEHDESPRTAATREIAEEFGLHTTGRLLALDYVPTDPDPDPDPDRGRTEGMVVCSTAAPSPTPPSPTPPSSGSPRTSCRTTRSSSPRSHRYLPALQTRRAIAALQASATGHAAYLENGHQPS